MMFSATCLFFTVKTSVDLLIVPFSQRFAQCVSVDASRGVWQSLACHQFFLSPCKVKPTSGHVAVQRHTVHSRLAPFSRFGHAYHSGIQLLHHCHYCLRMSKMGFRAHILAHHTRQVAFLRLPHFNHLYRHVSLRVHKSFVDPEHGTSGITNLSLDIDGERKARPIQRMFLRFCLSISDGGPARRFQCLGADNSGA